MKKHTKNEVELNSKKFENTDMREGINATQATLEQVIEWIHNDLSMIVSFANMARNEPEIVKAMAKVLHERYVHQEVSTQEDTVREPHLNVRD